MRIAGVRLEDGQMVWLDAGELNVVSLHRVTAQIDGVHHVGEVFVVPEQLLAPPERVDGLLVEAHVAHWLDDDCAFLPGVDLPVLGQPVSWGDAHGTIIGLDALGRRATIAYDQDQEAVVPIDDITRD